MAKPFTRRLASVAKLALRLAPRRFRNDYGHDFNQTFVLMLDQERARRGVWSMLVLWIRGLADVVGVARAERQIAHSGRRRAPLNDLSGDVRAAVRAARRSPGFSLTIVMTLVLGLGLSSAIFAFADGYLFRPLPFPQADRLFFVRVPGALASALTASEAAALRTTGVSHLGFVEWGGTTALPHAGELLIGDRRVVIRVDGVSTGFSRVVQVPLAMGRAYASEDYAQTSQTPVWLSYKFWQREFSGDRGVLGRTYTVAGMGGRSAQVVIVGIMAEQVTAFDLNNPSPEVVAPALAVDKPAPNQLSFSIVRLPDDMSTDQATSAIAAALEAVAPGTGGKPRTVRLSSVYEYLVSGGRPTARVFAVGALLVMLLVTINLIHLLLTRAVVRAPEIATRMALGASRWRIVRVFVVESVVLGAVGIAGGLLLGAWLSSVIAASIPGFPTGARNLSLISMVFDARAIGFAAALGFLISVFGGCLPAWRAVRSTRISGNASGGSGVQTISLRLSRIILASEVAIATVIMVGTVFMSLGIWRYLNQPLGFDIQDRIRVYWTPLPGTTPAAIAAIDWSATVEAVRSARGVRAASVTSAMTGPITIGDAVQTRNDIQAWAIGRDYFETTGSKLHAGRLMLAQEIAEDAPVAVVDEKFARLVWPGQDPLGKMLRIKDSRPRQIVGVVGHERYRLSVATQGIVYVPQPKIDRNKTIVAWAPGMGASDLIERISAPLSSIAPGFSVAAKPVTFEDLFLRDTGEAYFQRPVVIVFGLFAFVLAGVGLFGLVTYIVAQRTRDFGIRLALGARPADIRRQVISQSVIPAAIGLAVGLTAAGALERVVRASVFGWESSGALAMAIVGIALLAVAILAAAGPARRALRIDPIRVLREQ